MKTIFCIAVTLLVTFSVITASKNICELPLKPGPGELQCLAYFPSYYFNSQTGKCTYFIYGGCGGNANRFSTLDACEKACNLCDLRLKPGPGEISCYAYIPSWYYNSNTGTCQYFIYGGCNGNANRFSSLTDCQQACP